MARPAPPASSPPEPRGFRRAFRCRESDPHRRDCGSIHTSARWRLACSYRQARTAGSPASQPTKRWTFCSQGKAELLKQRLVELAADRLLGLTSVLLAGCHQMAIHRTSNRADVFIPFWRDLLVG